MSRFIVLLALGCLALQAETTTRLVLVGGVAYPEAAMKRFVEWAKQKTSPPRILVVIWGGMGHNSATFERLKRALKPYSPGAIEMAPLPEEMDDSGRNSFLEQIARASGIFFTGGTQQKIMDIIDKKDLGDVLRFQYYAGVVFGGASAGTAIMSKTMLTGKADNSTIQAGTTEVSHGLGLIESGIIDQHFHERNRQNRLMSLLLNSNERWALGVDEGNAVAVENEDHFENLGDGFSSWFCREENNRITWRLLPHAEALVLRCPSES